jgi:Ca-activated chloride channel family protein
MNERPVRPALFRRVLALVFSTLTVLTLVAVASSSAKTQQQQPPPTDPRPRRVEPQKSGPPGTATPKPSPSASPSQTPGEGDEIDPEAIVRVESNLVVLNVRVIDRNNRPINDVRRDEFQVFENNVAQPIESFSKEELPISYGLAVDTSGSLRSQLPQVIDAAKTIINTNKEGDETFLLRFIDSEKIETVKDFTASKDDLIDAVDSLYVEGGQTAVIDAVYLASEHVAQYKKNSDGDRRRRALIVVTDGEDRNSYYKREQLFERLREEDVQIYIIGFVNELDSEAGLIRKSKRDQAMSLLDRLAKETGGRVFYPKSIAELPRIADEITRDMRTQYVIAYNPTNKNRDGSFRSIKVSVSDNGGKDKRIALTRSGRVAAREGSAPASVKPASTRGDKPGIVDRTSP